MSKPDSREPLARALADAPDLPNPLPIVAPPPAGALVPSPAAAVPAVADPPAENSVTPYLDANGFDPEDYRWVPVRRRPRADGFSEAKQRLFIETLADTGSVEVAAQSVGLTVQSCYRLRRSPGAEAFAAAWAAAIQQAALKLVDIAFDRAINGSDEPVFDREGRRVGRRKKPSDSMLMFLMRAHLPAQYQHAHHAARAPVAPTPPATLPVAQALATLEPVTPPDPHTLAAPEQLDIDVEVADLCDGTLPPWHDPAVPEPAPADAWAVPPKDPFDWQAAQAREDQRDADDDGYDDEEDDEEDGEEGFASDDAGSERPDPAATHPQKARFA